MNRRFLVLSAAALLALAPSVTASWIAYGSKEPSTSYDTTDYNWFDPDTDSDVNVQKVYFNAFPSEISSAFVGPGQSPNVGALETHFRPVNMIWEAVLGVWKDCNNDGYLGHAESALTSYRAELLTSDEACPAGTSPHNDGQWVHEYRIFAMVDPCNWATDEEVAAGSGHACQGFARDVEYEVGSSGLILVNNTKVWGDSFKPDFKSDANPGSSCPLTPSQGTTSHSGLFLRFVDCLIGVTGAVNTVDGVATAPCTVWPEGPITSGKLGPADVPETADYPPAPEECADVPSTPTGLRFEDTDNPQNNEGHPLIFSFPVTLYDDPTKEGQSGLISEGSRESSNPMFTTWDCTEEATTVEDPSGGTLRHVAVTDPTGTVPTSVADPTGEIESDGTIELADENGEFAGFNATDEDGNVLKVYQLAPTVSSDPTQSSVLDALNQTDDGSPGVGPIGADDCTKDDDGFLTNGAGTLDNPGQESQTQAAGKTANDWGFLYSYGALQVNLGANEDLPGGAGDLIGNAPPMPRSTWASREVLVGNTPEIGAVRRDLSPGEPSYYTFYAQVDLTEAGTNGWSLPGGSGIYGADQCSTIGPGAELENGWECDPALWYKNAVGTDNADRYQSGFSRNANVGEAYQLRDVDCIDSGIAGQTLPTVIPCA